MRINLIRTDDLTSDNLFRPSDIGDVRCITKHFNNGNLYAEGTKFEGLNVRDGYMNALIQDNTPCVTIINNLCDDDMIFLNDLLPFILYDIKVGGNIISKDGLLSLYIDSQSFENFKGKFIGNFQFIKVYPHDKYNKDNLELLLSDDTLVEHKL